MTDQTPSRAVARYDGPRTTDELHRYASLLAGTQLANAYRPNETLPQAFRGNPAAVAFAVEYGKALDVSPVTALIGIHIVDGKPTASAGLISALVRRAGHRIRTSLEGSIDDGTAKAVTTITRADDPDFEYRSEWTLGRAVRAGLMKREGDRIVATKNKSAWSTYPESMLKARTITECARDAAEDALLGVHYTPEELGADVDEAGEVVHTVTQVQPPTPDDAPPSTDHPRSTPTGDQRPQAWADDVDVPALAARVGAQILAARDRAALQAVWNDAAGIASYSGRAAALTVTNEQGDEETALELFKRASAAIDAGEPLAVPSDPAADDAPPDTVDAEVVEDAPADQPAAAPVRSEFDQMLERIRTGDQRAARRALEVVTNNLKASAVDDASAWAQREGTDPRVNPANTAALFQALGSGDALSDATLTAYAEDGVDVAAMLVELVAIDQADNAADGGHGNGNSRSAAARAEARRAASAATR